MTTSTLMVDIDRSIATVTINRPEALNALNRDILAELTSLFERLTDDPAVQVIILTGQGDKAFVAGADIAAMQSLDPLEARQFAELGHKAVKTIETCSKPVIAAVNGYALGGGCEIALGCDLRIASESAFFGQPEVNLGIIPGFGGTQRLSRLVGKGRALELILSGEMIDAHEAYRIGLANKVVPPSQLLDTARSLAGKILKKGPLAVRTAKQAVNNGLELDLDRANRYEIELFSLCFATKDQKEGMAAFLEKRRAEFSNS